MHWRSSALPRAYISRLAAVSVIALGLEIGALHPGVGVGAPSLAVHRCATFIVGEANSTAYPDQRLPARGIARGASCVTLRRIARRLNDGTYPVPAYAPAPAPRWGRYFPVHDGGRRWSCQLQNRGASGPSYAVRCRSGSARLDWNTG